MLNYDEAKPYFVSCTLRLKSFKRYQRGKNYEGFCVRARIRRTTLPDGVYAYDMKKEQNQKKSELPKFLLKSPVEYGFWGTFVTTEPVPFPEDRFAAEIGGNAHILQIIGYYEAFAEGGRKC
jgi:hypothetical protein